MGDIIKHTEIAEAMQRDMGKDFKVGAYIVDSYSEHLFLITKMEYRTIRDEQVEWFSYEGINPITLEKNDDNRVSSINELKEYYRVLEGDPTRLRDMAHRVLNDGASIEEFTESSDTSLMAMGNKQTLIALRSQIDEAQKGVAVIKRYCNLVHKQMERQIEAKLRQVQGVVEKMNREIKKLDYVIQTIETYAGIKEEVVTIFKGEPAPETEPIVIRQAVLFMDEEFALIDDDFDWRKIGKFDDWLSKDDNFKIILPDPKSIVAIKPRRTDKQYSDNFWENIIMNRPNHVTLFLIRNGENLYRLESGYIYLKDRMFPNLDEYQKTLEEEKKDGWYEQKKENGELRSDDMRRTFTKVAFLLQGLVDRSDVFAPHNVSCSFLKMEGLDGSIRMEYELDTSHLLQDGRPSVKDWMRQQNEGIKEGSRILLISAKGMSGDCFLRYYNKGSEPDYPDAGVYTVKSNPQYHPEEKDSVFARDARTHPYIISYKPVNDAYSWTDGWTERKNKVSICFGKGCGKYINYDSLSIEELDYYLHNRLYRSQYFDYIRLLKTARSLIEKEYQQESEFINMLCGELISNNLWPKDGLTHDSITRIALQTVKNRLKWKRPISSKERETYYLVRRTLFSENFKKKYFK